MNKTDKKMPVLERLAMSRWGYISRKRGQDNVSFFTVLTQDEADYLKRNAGDAEIPAALRVLVRAGREAIEKGLVSVE